MNQQEREAIGKAVYDADGHGPWDTPWEHLGTSQNLSIIRGEAAINKYLEMRKGKILFNNQQHLDRFLDAIQSIGQVYDGDKIDVYYGSALYILSSQASTLESAKKYIHHDHIDFEEMLKNVHFGGAYTVLIQFASNIFNGNTDVDFEEFMRLDGNNFAIAVTALQFRYWGAIHAVRLSDLEVRQ